MGVEPTFFGANQLSHNNSGNPSESQYPLFGHYHPPQSFHGPERAVLICYPILQEHIRSYRACFNLANKLASEGCHVLRFDYFGTGDSAGDLEQATLECWLENIAAAIDELKSLSGLNAVSVIGLRFGATLAVMQTQHCLDRLILWDPVINGNTYLENLRSVQTEMLNGVERFPRRRVAMQRQGVEEITGFSLNNSLIQAIEAIDLFSYEPCQAKQKYLVAGENLTDYQVFIENQKSKIEFHLTNEPGDWHLLGKIEDMLMSHQSISALSQKVVA